MRVRTPNLLVVLLAGAMLPAAAAAQPGPPPPPPPAPPSVEVTQTRVEVDHSGSLSTDTLFEVGEDKLRPAANPVLDAIAKALAKDQQSKLTVDVYTDDAAPDGDRSGQWLQKLSQRRAEAVKAYLVRKGVAARRLTALGHGREHPVGTNASEDGRTANRRLEMSIEVEVRPPLAADLAVYAKQVRGTGPKLIATIATSLGTIHCELFEATAPVTVANFIGLATGQKAWVDPAGKIQRNKPFYDGLVFHRVIPNFMIQGGDPQGIGVGGPGYKFEDELAVGQAHEPGTLSMANAGPNTNGSQFFVTEAKTPWLDGTFTIFGRCKEVDVVSKIANVPRGRNDVPNDPVKIKTITFARP